eukprot:CAMPEP_0172633424 /NCGR_PEP_ID=MMETSP1068-20121228/189381_1 /TAXON_ID=35684 /ORGANISM="Pseudopedinella elastica, Strain CCMP716" /LENGTH=94 /DNA_ID=CAMNT_0013445119 /DNA_START=672 /DNA_END=953 /DNA_ORIENTATION=+
MFLVTGSTLSVVRDPTNFPRDALLSTAAMIPPPNTNARVVVPWLISMACPLPRSIDGVAKGVCGGALKVNGSDDDCALANMATMPKRLRGARFM